MIRPAWPAWPIWIAAWGLLTIGCGDKSASVFEAYKNDPEAVQRGRSLFIGTCGGYCHASFPGPADAPYLFDCETLHGGRDEDMFAIIANGVPNTRMLSFKGKLPDGDADIYRLVAYISVNRKCS